MPYKDKRKQSEYQNRQVKAARKQWLDENGQCRFCGSSIDLEVDHIDPLTKVSHRIWSWSKQRRDAELAKCQPLCKKCHREKSISAISLKINHGTHSGYAYYGCRCDECKRAHAQYCHQRKRAILIA
jgi:hypothetical protein